MIPGRVVTWAREQLLRPIVSIEPLAGGLTDSISAIRLRDERDPVILRHLGIAAWGDEGRQHVTSESLACRLLEGRGLPAPRLLASDPDGSGSGGFANLTTWLPGRVRLDALSELAIDQLAAVAVRIHAVPVPDDQRPPPYAFWTPTDLRVPAWATRPELWERAIAIFEGPRPGTAAGLIHRDFHPGNILWEGDRLTGVIDWAETSWGPADLDVAHCCANFVILHRPDRAVLFRRAYLDHGGVLEQDVAAAAFWVIGDILGFLPDPAHIVRALTHVQPDLTAAVVHTRLEDLLAETLQTLG